MKRLLAAHLDAIVATQAVKHWHQHYAHDSAGGIVGFVEAFSEQLATELTNRRALLTPLFETIFPEEPAAERPLP